MSTQRGLCYGAVSAPKSLETLSQSHRPLAQFISFTTEASDFLILSPPPWLFHAVDVEKLSIKWLFNNCLGEQL